MIIIRLILNDTLLILWSYFYNCVYDPELNDVHDQRESGRNEYQ